jgi:hypothetical protein
LEKAIIPAGDPKVQQMRSHTVRWGVVFGLLQRPSARSPEEAKANLRKRYSKVAERILEPTGEPIRRALINELAERDTKFLPVGLFDMNRAPDVREKMRMAIEEEEVQRVEEAKSKAPAVKPEVLQLTDEELLSIGAAFALDQMDSFRVYHPSNAVVGPRLMDWLKKFESRINAEITQQLIDCLKKRAGDKYEEFDDGGDIPY